MGSVRSRVDEVSTDREGDDMAQGSTGPAESDAAIQVPEQVSYRVKDERRGDVVLRHARLTGRAARPSAHRPVPSRPEPCTSGRARAPTAK